MKKILKIQFWKAEKALAMQILEQEGLPKEKRDGKVHILGEPDLWADDIFLRGYDKDDFSKIAWITFNTEYDRNTYLHWAVNAITDELFTGKGKLEAGWMCEVSDCERRWKRRKLIAILPEKYVMRFIAEWHTFPAEHRSWRYARPITKRTEPKIEECGQLVTYTWEEE